MAHPTVEVSPQVYARTGGLLYLIIIVIGVSGEAFVRDTLIVAGDAAATAANIRAAEGLWRASLSGEIAYLACAVPLAVIFYVLLSPVSRNLALLVVLFNLVSIAIESVNKLNLLAASFFSVGAGDLNAFEPPQLHALTTLALRLFAYGFGISLIFFGCLCLVLGYLIGRSGYLPKAIGVLMQIAGVCYLVNSFALLLAPALAAILFPAILVPAFVAELSLALWLLVKGVDLAEWQERVSR